MVLTSVIVEMIIHYHNTFNMFSLIEPLGIFVTCLPFLFTDNESICRYNLFCIKDKIVFSFGLPI